MLTKEAILSRYQVDSLSDIKKISMWGSDIEDISILSQVPNLTVLSLSVNKIKSLSPLSSCLNLRELYLRKNFISSLAEINHLTPCKQLSILWLEENPICHHPNYHSHIIKLLPQLTKLDNEVIKQEFPFLTVKVANGVQDKNEISNAIKRLRRATSSIDGSKMSSNVVINLQPFKNEGTSFMKLNQINYSLGEFVLQTEKKLNSSKSKERGLFKKIKLKISSEKRIKNPIPKCNQLNKQPILKDDNNTQLIKSESTTANNNNNYYYHDKDSNNGHIVKAILNLIEKIPIQELIYVSDEIESMLQQNI